MDVSWLVQRLAIRWWEMKRKRQTEKSLASCHRQLLTRSIQLAEIDKVPIRTSTRYSAFPTVTAYGKFSELTHVETLM